MENKEYTELEIISLLEREEIEVNYKNIKIVKESIAEGIILDESWFSKFRKKKKQQAVVAAAAPTTPQQPVTPPEGISKQKNVGNVTNKTNVKDSTIIDKTNSDNDSSIKVGRKASYTHNQTTNIQNQKHTDKEEININNGNNYGPIGGTGNKIAYNFGSTAYNRIDNSKKENITNHTVNDNSIKAGKGAVVNTGSGEAKADNKQTTHIGDEIKHSITNKVDNSTNKKEDKKSIVVKGEGNKITEALLNLFLVEECGMSLNEYNELSSETKIESLKTIALELLSVIENKINSVDSSSADRSRGDIKQLKELPFLQDAITQLETLIERDENALPEYSKAVSIVIKAILYINQYSNTFKDAYRNKKTLMILKYESLILSIISSVSYLLSTIVDYKADYLSLKGNIAGIMEFAPLKSLNTFIQSVDSGEFKIVSNDVAVIREYYLEVPVEKMGMILESTDYLPMIVDSVKSIYRDIVGNGKLTNLIYRAVGAIILLFSLRDVFYTLFRMKTKVSEMVAGIENFANINNGGNLLQKLNQFANKYRTDAENSSDISKKEIEDENKKMLTQVRKIQVSNPIENKPSEEASALRVDDEGDIFGFDF